MPVYRKKFTRYDADEIRIALAFWINVGRVTSPTNPNPGPTIAWPTIGLEVRRRKNKIIVTAVVPEERTPTQAAIINEIETFRRYGKSFRRHGKKETAT